MLLIQERPARRNVLVKGCTKVKDKSDLTHLFKGEAVGLGTSERSVPPLALILRHEIKPLAKTLSSR